MPRAFPTTPSYPRPIPRRQLHAGGISKNDPPPVADDARRTYVPYERQC